MEKTIKIKYPKPYEEVKHFFVVKGLVPFSWLDNDGYINNRVSLDILDIDGRTFIGRSIKLSRSFLPRRFFKKDRMVKFKDTIVLDKINMSFVAPSQGMITLRFTGTREGQNFFLPVKIKSTNPNFLPDKKLVEKHKIIGETVLRLDKEWKEYLKQLEEIMKRRSEKTGIDDYKNINYTYINDDNINFGVFGLLNDFEFDQKASSFFEEDQAIKQLEEKFKETIEINGPLLGANILVRDGFHFIKYSNDHGRHFHIIHKGRGLDVRMSFPGLIVESYKSGMLKSKDEKKLVSFLKQPNNFKKLEDAFKN